MANKVNEILNVYKDKTKVLCVEKPNSQSDLRTRRIDFYKRKSIKVKIENEKDF